MRKDLTFIAVVLDRSGSMGAVREATITGFNAFVEEQKTAPGDALFTLVQFDHEYQKVFDGVPIGRVELLSDATYVPRGNTALYDAVGRTIDDVGAKLRSMREEDRPGKVIVMIQTDGAENASRKYTSAKLAEMIQHQREQYQWEFVFVGATEAALTDARDWGISGTKMTSYTPDAAGTGQILRVMSAGTSKYRGMVLNDASEQELIGMNYFTPDK